MHRYRHYHLSDSSREYTILGGDDNLQVVHPKIYAGNLTEAVPTTDPFLHILGRMLEELLIRVERETIKYLLTINSKFRPEYKPYNCLVEPMISSSYPSQGDLIRENIL